MGQRGRWLCRAGGKRVCLEGQLRLSARPQLEPGLQEPHVGEQVSHDPEELLRNYAALQGEIGELRDQLKAVLAEALERQV